MLDVKQLEMFAPQVLRDIRQHCDANHDGPIEIMSANEAFMAFCTWNGIIHWSETLSDALDNIRAACVADDDDVKRALNALARHAIKGAKEFIRDANGTDDEPTPAHLMSTIENLIREGVDYDSDVLEEAQQILDRQKEGA